MNKSAEKYYREYSSGIGFDSHAFEPSGKAITLGGVTIPFEMGFKSHSDGDVLIHALIDALLGAAGLDDIGTYFPDTDDTYKNIASTILLEKTLSILQDKHFEIVNTDSVIIAERPRLTPYKQKIRTNLAQIIGIDGSKIGVKAKTAEGLGFIGEGAGIAVFTTVLLSKTVNLLWNAELKN